MAKRKKKIARLDSSYMNQYDAYVERQKKKKQRLKRRLMLFSMIALFVIGGLATYHFKQRVVHADKVEQYEQLQEELVSLKEAEKNYKEEIGLLNDDEYILEIARTNYFFSKKGELIFKIPDESPSY